MVDQSPLPRRVTVLPGADVAALRRRYEVYEAMHRAAGICAPMSEHDLDRVLDAANPAGGDRIVDIGCGHGELLLRAARRAAVSGVGVDESPWAISRAAEAAAERPEAGGIDWWLGDARTAPLDDAFDVAVCVGAAHIWHGFEGTLRGLLKRTRLDGRVVIGELRPAGDGRDAQLRILERHDVAIVDEVIAGRDGWDRYRRDVEKSITEYAARRPIRPDDAVLDVRDEWLAAHAADARRLEWAVWIGTVGS